jgi:energy-coupling factor transporter ATP-binding protein EcfA2
MHTKLSLSNFTVFSEADFGFVSGINVLVGANATGKTHLMKLLYAVQKHQEAFSKNSQVGPLDPTLSAVFNADGLGRLVRRRVGIGRAGIEAFWDGRKRSFELNTRSGVLQTSGQWANVTTPVYIPVKDMLAHSKGFGSLYRSREIDFEQVYADIIDLAMLPPIRGPVSAARKPLLDALRRSMKGTVIQKGERFYLRTREGGHVTALEMPLVAEGWRKLALLWLLIQNESLTRGRVLFWDEPEANLNPSMFRVVGEVLHRLAESGVQVFVATHNYLILQELELQRLPSTSFQYIVLARTDDGEVEVSTATEYLSIQPNLIEQQYAEVYDRRLAKRLGGQV